ncbi:MAG TPA: hypothetical protein VMI54_13905 [Polyangiaceae bacterium]|nr:hypothetical protein [Polyangiaceae bacterium]
MTSIKLAPFVVALAGCTRPEPALYASAADQPAYAERYPAELGTTQNAYLTDDQQAQTLASGFAKYPDQLDKPPSYAAVLEVVKAADQAGKSADLAAGMAEAEEVRAFFTANKDPIHQKVAGSVDYAAKQKQCDAELAGTAVGAMDRAIDQEVDETVRSHNAATRVIEDNQDALGRQNLDKLTKQSDQLALASYIVHVRMPQTKRNLDAALGDAGTVKKTLERDQEQAKAVLDDPHASKAAKVTADKRSAAASNALAALDAEIADAKKLSQDMDKRTQAAQKSYEDALKALEDDLAQRAQAQAKK